MLSHFRKPRSLFTVLVTCLSLVNMLVLAFNTDTTVLAKTNSADSAQEIQVTGTSTSTVSTEALHTPAGEIAAPASYANWVRPAGLLEIGASSADLSERSLQPPTSTTAKCSIDIFTNLYVGVGYGIWNTDDEWYIDDEDGTGSSAIEVDPTKGISLTFSTRSTGDFPANPSAIATETIIINPVNRTTDTISGTVTISGNAEISPWQQSDMSSTWHEASLGSLLGIRFRSGKPGEFKLTYDVLQEDSGHYGANRIPYQYGWDCRFDRWDDGWGGTYTCKGEVLENLQNGDNNEYLGLDHVLSNIPNVFGHPERFSCVSRSGNTGTNECTGYSTTRSGTFEFEFPCKLVQSNMSVELNPRPQETKEQGSSLIMPVEVKLGYNGPLGDNGWPILEDVRVALFLDGTKVGEEPIDTVRFPPGPDGKYTHKFDVDITDQLVAGEGEAGNLEFKATANATGEEEATATASAALDVRPRITKIDPVFQLKETYFLDVESSLDNRIKVLVDWNGDISAPSKAPHGTVDFELNNRPRTRLGLEWGADETKDMSNDFNVDNQCENNTYVFTAKNLLASHEFESEPEQVDITVFPVPEWLKWALSVPPGAPPLTPEPRAPYADYTSQFAFPELPFSIGVDFKEAGLGPLGSYGIESVQFKTDVAVSTEGTGKGEAKLQGKLKIKDDSFGGVGGGKVKMRALCGQGLSFVDGELFAMFEGETSKAIKLTDYLPFLREASRTPLKRIIEALLVVEVSPTAGLATEFRVFLKEENDRLVWDPAQSFEGKLEGSFKVPLQIKIVVVSLTLEGGVSSFIVYQIPPDPDYKKDAGAAGTIGAKLQYGIFVGGIQGGYEAFSVKCQLTCSEQSGCTSGCGDGSLLAADSSTNSWTWQPIPRNYVDEGYAHYAAQPMIRTVALDNELSANPGVTETLIIADIYPYPQPDLALVDTEAGMIVYVHDDPTKPAGRGTEIYSVRRQNGQWQPPVPVTDNIQPDLTPQVSFDAQGNAIAVWEQVGLSLEITPTLDVAYFQSLDIVSSVWDGTTWSAPTKLTDDNLADHEPLLERSADGKVMALWRTHDGEDVLGIIDHPLSLTYSIWSGSQWSPPTAAVTGLHELMNVGFAVHSTDDAVVVFSRDMDGDLTTTDDRELFYAEFDGTSWAGPVRMTDDDLPDDLPQVAFDSEGNRMLVWQRGDELIWTRNSWNVADARPVSGDGGHNATGYALAAGLEGAMALVWSELNLGGSDLVYQLYDASTDEWQRSVSATQDADVEAEPSIAMVATDQIQVAYNQLETELEDVTVEAPDGSIYTIEDVPTTGASNLSHLIATFNPGCVPTCRTYLPHVF